MVDQAARFSDALRAWEFWSLTEFDYRSKCLLSIFDVLNKDKIAISSIVEYHLQSAQQAVGQIDMLVGPTGETNELYTAGRGVVLLIQDQECQSARSAIIAQLTAAAVAGNSIIICSDDAQLVQWVQTYFAGAVLPIGLIQVVSRDSVSAFVQNDIRTVGFVGAEKNAIKLNRELVNSDGVIIGLVAEFDLDSLPTSHDPRLSFRFVTERTRTINITAIGGNASLLELGSGDH